MRTTLLLSLLLTACGGVAPTDLEDPTPDAGSRPDAGAVVGVDADAGLVVVALADGGTTQVAPCDGFALPDGGGCGAQNCAGPGEQLSELAGDGQLVIYGPAGACNGAGCQVGWICCPGSEPTTRENSTVCLPGGTCAATGSPTTFPTELCCDGMRPADGGCVDLGAGTRGGNAG